MSQLKDIVQSEFMKFKNEKFVINSQNCIHCKTCDIKEPSQNITWVVRQREAEDQNMEICE